MAVDDKVQLKERVQQFVDQHNRSEGTWPIRVVCDEGNLYFILYGADIATGIAGFGETADGAFNDFKDNWFRYRSIKESAQKK
jgi:hypothetical protein